MPSFPILGAAPMTSIAAVTILLAYCVDVGTSFVPSSCTRHHRLSAFVNENSFPPVGVLDKDISISKEDLIPVSSDLQDTVVIGDNKALKKLNFESDIQELIDVDRPYYAIKNECNVIDVITEESVGFVSTVQGEMAVSRESGGISFAEVGRHSAVAATCAAALKNPMPGRFHYLANEYEWKVMPREGNMPQELSDLINNGKFSLPETASDDECIIYSRCDEVSKRHASTTNYFVTKDDIYLLALKLSLVSAQTFKKMNRDHENEEVSHAHHNPYLSNGESKNSLKNHYYYNEDCVDDWVTLEASLDKVRTLDCVGHFHRGCKILANPHSLMLLHNGDLIGQAISKLTNREIPYKLRDEDHQGDDKWGIKLVNWKCTPENLHFANRHGLNFQVRVYHNAGRLGEAGSSYNVQSLVTEQGTNLVSYESSGTFVLEQLP